MINRIFNWLLRRKPEEKRYWLDAERTYHFYGDCPSMKIKTKMVSSLASIKYDLCVECRERHGVEMHKNATDFDEKLECYIKGMVSNVLKLELSKEEKATKLRFGLAYILITGMFLHILDAIGGATGSKENEELKAKVGE